MPMREVKPLGEQQWEQVSKMVTCGPTTQSIQNLKEVLKLADEIKESEND